MSTQAQVRLPDDVREVSARLLHIAGGLDTADRKTVLRARHMLEREATSHQQLLTLVSSRAAVAPEDR